jgi:hypothetical protein
MSSRSSGPAKRPVAVALFLIALSFVVAVVCAATAHAAVYKMLTCAAGNGLPPFGTTTNTASPQNPGGIFEFSNYCGLSGGDPPGDSAFARINENQAAGNAAEGAYGNFIFEIPGPLHFMAAGGYTREPYAFNDGWRAKLWISGLDGNIDSLNQGAGVGNAGVDATASNTFGPHLWPFGNFYNFNHLIFELRCVRPGGCDRSNYNAADLNDLVFFIADDSPAQANFTNTSSPLFQGAWVRGEQEVDWSDGDQGSGLRDEHLRVDGAPRYEFDYRASNDCDIGFSQTNGEWAGRYNACPTGGPFPRSRTLDTSSLADGAHNLSICAQDLAQYQGLYSTGSESCDQRTIRVDNHPPGTPLALQVTSANPARYLDHFGAKFAQPPDPGSPIVKVHYDVIDANNNVVVPEHVVSGTNLTALPDISGPAQPGNYRLQVWLEDEVGFTGPAAVAQIPHDTTPPAAPQGLSVTSPQTSRATDGFDVRWRDLTDSGSPIAAAHYQVVNAAGKVIVPTHDLSGEGIQAISNLDAPKEAADSILRVWLSDSEGNVGAPVSAPLSYDCARSDVGGGTDLSAGLGDDAQNTLVVGEGQGSTITGKLQGPDGRVAGAALCVFSTVVTDQDRQFLGIAMTSASGGYQFAIGAGASRNIAVTYRPDQRELTATATLRTKVGPSFKLRRKVIHNKGFAVFTGSIPGPHSEEVVVVLQVKDGKHWRVFRRYQTREGGQFLMRYRFTQTRTPTTYRMRAEVPNQSGYPYDGGDSRSLPLRVLP